MKDVAGIIDESIRLELNVARLYTLFYELFPEHGDFWWTLSIEEKNHASLLLTGKQHFISLGLLPKELLTKKMEKLKIANHEIESLHSRFSLTPPSIEEAFDAAIRIEESSGEIHFQNFMKKKSRSSLEEVFHHLNNNDIDHADRIRRYKAKNVNKDNIDRDPSILEKVEGDR